MKHTQLYCVFVENFSFYTFVILANRLYLKQMLIHNTNVMPPPPKKAFCYPVVPPAVCPSVSLLTPISRDAISPYLLKGV